MAVTAGALRLDPDPKDIGLDLRSPLSAAPSMESFLRLETFQEVLDRNQGLGPGFDAVRLFLATSVLLWHSILLAYGMKLFDDPFWLIFWSAAFMIVPAFFGLSGFLVTGSMLRVKEVRAFIAFRALRIFPALIVEICLSALILGPIVTNLALSRYFSDSLFWSYFANVIGFVQFRLPGVFTSNPFDYVNGQLWTVPSEMLCYITLGTLMAFKVAPRRRVILFLFVIASLASTLSLRHDRGSDQSWQGLLLCFYAGSLMYLYREKIPVHLGLFVASCIWGYCVHRFVPHAFPVLGPIPMTYIAVYLGMNAIPRVPLLMTGDYSYGIYLYGAPIQQTLIWLFPGNPWWLMFLVAFPITAFWAAFSWHWIEKRALKLRKLIAPGRVLERPLEAT
jgi:peptidoglycan/LPS O-acetylase OafA/YrhL